MLSLQAASASGPKGKKDPMATKSYKQLVQLRKGFDALVQLVEDTVGGCCRRALLTDRRTHAASNRDTRRMRSVT